MNKYNVLWSLENLLFAAYEWKAKWRAFHARSLAFNQFVLATHFQEEEQYSLSS